MRLITLEFKRVISRPITYIVLLGLPILFISLGSVFFNSFGADSLKIGVYSEDKSPLSKFTVGIVMSLFHGGTIQYVGPDYVEKLKNGELNAVVIIPSDFTTSLFLARETEIRYVPSPVDTQLSAAAYLVFKKLFEDLSGGPFFNPKVLQQMYTSSSVPAPKLVTDKEVNFSQVFAPSLILLITMFAAMLIGAGSVANDKERGLFLYYSIGKIKPYHYYIAKFTTTFLISFVAGSISYFGFLINGFSMNILVILTIILSNALFHTALGIAISAFSQNTMSSNLIAAILGVLLLFSSGSLMSVSSLPEIGKKILNVIPIYKSVYLLRIAQLFSAEGDFKVLIVKNLLLSIIGASIFVALSIVCIQKEFSPKRELTI